MGHGSQNIGNQTNMDNYPPKKKRSAAFWGNPVVIWIRNDPKEQLASTEQTQWYCFGLIILFCFVWTFIFVLLVFCLFILISLFVECFFFFVALLLKRQRTWSWVGREVGRIWDGWSEDTKYTVGRTVFFNEEIKRKEMTLSVYVLKWCYCHDGIMKVLTPSRDRKYWWSHTWMELWKMPN